MNQVADWVAQEADSDGVYCAGCLLVGAPVISAVKGRRMKQEWTEEGVELHTALCHSTGSTGAPTTLQSGPELDPVGQTLMTSRHSVIAPHWGRKWPQVRSFVQIQQSLKGLASEDCLFTTFPVTGAASDSLTGHLGSTSQCPHHYYLHISILILAG